MTRSVDSTDEFRKFLEWQIMTQLRRQQSFVQPVLDSRRLRWKPGVVIILAIMIGFAGSAAIGQLQETQDKDQILAVLQAELELAEIRVTLAEHYLQEARLRFSTGLVGRESIEGAERDLNLVEVDRSRIQLKLEEVEITGKLPRDDFTSPLVGERDFVGERLQFDMEVARYQESLATRNHREASHQYEAGLISHLALLEIQTEVIRATGEITAVNLMVALRNQFLAGSIEAAEAAKRRVLIQIQNRLVVARSLAAQAEQRYELIRDMFEAGEVEEVFLLRSQLQMLTMESELSKLQEQLQRYEEEAYRGYRTADPPPSIDQQ